MIAPFIHREFGFTLEELITPLDEFVLPLMKVPVDGGVCEK